VEVGLDAESAELLEHIGAAGPVLESLQVAAKAGAAARAALEALDGVARARERDRRGEARRARACDAEGTRGGNRHLRGSV
jgi:hypothetical protein